MNIKARSQLFLFFPLLPFTPPSKFHRKALGTRLMKVISKRQNEGSRLGLSFKILRIEQTRNLKTFDT